MSETSETPAQRAARIMWAKDQAAQWMGMELVDVREGRATLSLTVQDHHCNGHGMLHGGVTFALADTAFAYACNSRGQRTVAQFNTISYLAPGQNGDKITAKASEIVLRGRSGIYDVAVTDQNGETIAQFRGQSRAIKGSVFEEET
jgi:acyl-CoA thioesterase